MATEYSVGQSVKNGLIILAIRFTPEFLLEEDAGPRLGTELVNRYRQIRGDRERRILSASCIVEIQPEIAGSTIDRALYDLWKEVTRNKGELVVVDYPEDSSAKAKFEHIWFRYVDWGIHNPVRHDLLIQLRLSDLVSKEAQHRQEEESSAVAELVDQVIQEDLLIDIPIMYLGAIFQAQLDAAVRYATRNELTDIELTRHIATGFEVFWRGVTK